MILCCAIIWSFPWRGGSTRNSRKRSPYIVATVALGEIEQRFAVTCFVCNSYRCSAIERLFAPFILHSQDVYMVTQYRRSDYVPHVYHVTKSGVH